MNPHLHRPKAGSVWFALVVLAGAAGGAIWMAMALRQAREPVHQGKSVGVWIAQMYSNPNDLTAGFALVDMGAPAIPYLIREVRRDGGPLGPFYRRFWVRCQRRNESGGKPPV